MSPIEKLLDWLASMMVSILIIGITATCGLAFLAAICAGILCLLGRLSCCHG